MELIAVAHPIEAEPLISRLQAQQESEERWRFEGGTLIITGMGIAAAAASVAHHAPGHTHILNIGFAGSLKRHPIGTVVEVGTCHRHLPQQIPNHSLGIARGAFPPLTLGSGANLLTSDYPIHSQEERTALSPYDLVDMEGYGVALAAQKANIPCTLLKVISDPCTDGGWEMIHTHLKSLQTVIADSILSFSDSRKKNPEVR
ncbi:MAG: hypothetical protein AB7F31_07165 [Parachlamydiales bacterium]